MATELGIWLANRGHEIHFITYDMPFRLRHNFSERLFFHTVNLRDYSLFKYPPYTMALSAKIHEVFEWHHLDLVHVHYAIPHAVAAFLAKEMSGGKLKTVTTLHGTDVTLIGQDPGFRPITRMAVSRSDAVTAVSESLKQDSANTYGGSSRIEVIPNFIDPERFHPDIQCDHFHPSAKNGEKILVHASNFRPIKRVTDVVRIFAKVNEKMPSRLFLIGDGDTMPQVREECRRLGVCERVEFLGEQDSVACILPRCDLFLLTSELESFGLAALEAMACGVPVVGSKAGGIPEVIEQGTQGYLCEVGNVDCMAEHALKILADDNLARFKQAAKIRAHNTFSIEKIGPLYEDLYNRVLSDIKS